MIDKFLYNFFGLLDKFGEHLDKIFFPKQKKKRKFRCKICNCKCHCKDGLHNHFFDGELCNCSTCRH
jgi:hypothetical protein